MSEGDPLDALTRIGPYRILERIGSGGMGAVFRAQHDTLGRVIALKVLVGDTIADDTLLPRFRREAAVAARLSHPGLVKVYDFGEAKGYWYIAMELVTGSTLAQRINARVPCPPADVARILGEVLDALAEVHQAGLVHRDVKPANVMVDDAGKVRLLDLGLVRNPQGTLLTGEGYRVGSPRYMPPELIITGVSDARSDLWQVGLLAYELITGQVAYPERKVTKLLEDIVKNDPPPLPKLPGATGERVRAFVTRCLKHLPEERFASCVEAAAFLAGRRPEAREGAGREGVGREGPGRDDAGCEGAGRNEAGREGAGREGAARAGDAAPGAGRRAKGVRPAGAAVVAASGAAREVGMRGAAAAIATLVGLAGCVLVVVLSRGSAPGIVTGGGITASPAAVESSASRRGARSPARVEEPADEEVWSFESSSITTGERRQRRLARRVPMFKPGPEGVPGLVRRLLDGLGPKVRKNTFEELRSDFPGDRAAARAAGARWRDRLPALLGQPAFAGLMRELATQRERMTPEEVPPEAWAALARRMAELADLVDALDRHFEVQTGLKPADFLVGDLAVRAEAPTGGRAIAAVVFGDMGRAQGRPAVEMPPTTLFEPAPAVFAKDGGPVVRALAADIRSEYRAPDFAFPATPPKRAWLRYRIAGGTPGERLLVRIFPALTHRSWEIAFLRATGPGEGWLILDPRVVEGPATLRVSHESRSISYVPPGITLDYLVLVVAP